MQSGWLCFPDHPSPSHPWPSWHLSSYHLSLFLTQSLQYYCSGAPRCGHGVCLGLPCCMVLPTSLSLLLLELYLQSFLWGLLCNTSLALGSKGHTEDNLFFPAHTLSQGINESFLFPLLALFAASPPSCLLCLGLDRWVSLHQDLYNSRHSLPSYRS